MVLLAAAVCNKVGKAVISRQFVEMTRSRIEGLLAAFPKLMSSGKQHTFVETDSVRYVYQPLEKLYMLLITTKASNILEDLETLRLFARVIPEYCKAMEESEIVEQSFPLIFAFDEIVALGYRESVNLAQIRTFTEMDSHEEKVYQAVRQTQEKEAKELSRRKEKALKQIRHEAMRQGGKASSFGGFGGGSSSDRPSAPTIESNPIESKLYTAPTKITGGTKGMKLGSKAKDVDIFVDQLMSEGQEVSHAGSKSSIIAKNSLPTARQDSVHLRIEEKISLTAARDMMLQNLEVHGCLFLRLTDEKYGRIHVNIENSDKKGIQLQTHPNVDKKLFQSQSIIGLKNPAKPFPLNQDIGLLRWRFQTQDSELMPLCINCWPTEVPPNRCDVNIDYDLQQSHLELNDVVISIPLPSGVGAPVVKENDGEYHYDSRRNQLEWRHPVIDEASKTDHGEMDFSINGHIDDFFPLSVSFVSKRPFCNIEISEISTVDSDSPVKFSSDVVFGVDKYEIV